MMSKTPDAPPEVQQKSCDIVNEADKVAAQLNEFINYSRPREVRRTSIPLSTLINEVVRALNYDLEEKSIRLQVTGEALTIEADEQMLRQAFFNLVLNAIQAVQPTERSRSLPCATTLKPCLRCETTDRACPSSVALKSSNPISPPKKPALA
jgi:nitrogen fixation/metabolism regulation signal transduction histidine kinase